MTVSEVFKMISAIIDEFGANGVFKSNNPQYPLQATKQYLEWKGQIVLKHTDTMPLQGQPIMEAIGFFYKNAISY